MKKFLLFVVILMCVAVIGVLVFAYSIPHPDQICSQHGWDRSIRVDGDLWCEVDDYYGQYYIAPLGRVMHGLDLN